MRFATFQDQIKKMIVYFHHHLKCRYISDKTGDNKLLPIRISRNTVSHRKELKVHQINDNRWDLLHSRIKLIITSSVGIFLTKQVIINFFLSESVETLYLLVNRLMLIKLRQSMRFVNLRKWLYFHYHPSVGIFLIKQNRW